MPNALLIIPLGLGLGLGLGLAMNPELHIRTYACTLYPSHPFRILTVPDARIHPLTLTLTLTPTLIATLIRTLTLTLTLTTTEFNQDMNSGVRARNLSNGCSQFCVVYRKIHSRCGVTPLRMSMDLRSVREPVSLF